MRLAIVVSHPVQYYAPLFCELARQMDLTVLYAHKATPQDQARAGFGVGFCWDVDLLSGYDSVFLRNVANPPSLNRFDGVDTPEIGQYLRQGRFDAVLLMGWQRKCLVQALFAAKRIGLPVMVRGDSHLETPRSSLKKAAKAIVYPPFLRSFDAALVVGRRNRAYWEHYRYPADRMFMSPHCVDNEWFAARATDEARASLRTRLGIKAQTPVALFSGKLLPFKRPLDILYAAALARKRGVPIEILVAGSGELEGELRTCAAALAVPVHILGFCNQTAMPGAYAGCDVLVLPSSGETWGLVVNEALASGRPVVVSNAVGCAPDIAERLGPSAEYPVGCTASLAARLQTVLTAPPSRNTIVRVAGAFSLQNAAIGIENAVRSVVGKRIGAR